MTRDANKTCEHCGAMGVERYANDGALVCDACAAYDQIVAAELRVSQAALHVVPTGNADHLAEAAARAAQARIALAVVMIVASLAMIVYAPWVPLAYVATGIGLVLGTILLVDARRLRQFATIDAPEIERRATSSPPASMFENHPHTQH